MLFHQSRRKTSERVRPHSNQSQPEATDRNIGVQAAPWQLQRWPVDRLSLPTPPQRFVHFPIPFFLPSFPWPAERAEGHTISRSLMDHLRSLGDKRGTGVEGNFGGAEAEPQLPQSGSHWKKITTGKKKKTWLKSRKSMTQSYSTTCAALQTGSSFSAQLNKHQLKGNDWCQSS